MGELFINGITAFAQNTGIARIFAATESSAIAFAGIDFCDYLHIGIINYHAPLQFGVVNISEESLFQIGLFNAGTNKIEKNFQIGLLNYNPKSYIPWLPIVNWDMGREVENDSSK